MPKKRDTQRSRVYAWERSQNEDGAAWRESMTLEEVEHFIKPIWRTERGRYGKTAYQRSPTIEAGRGGGIAYGSTRITLGRMARNQYYALHELAHCLDKTGNAGHGPRFMGILIGLLARHLGRDADTLLATAYERGLRVDVRSIGAVPVYHWHKRLEKLLPTTLMDAAIELGVSWRVVRGASMNLIKQRKARWYRKHLVALVQS